jgi:hypothetical protein
MDKKEVIQITKVPVVYQVWGRVEVKHRDDADLMQKLQNPTFVGNMPLPEKSGYIEDSYEIDFEGLDGFVREEDEPSVINGDIKNKIDMMFKEMADYGYPSEVYGVNGNVRMMSFTEKEARKAWKTEPIFRLYPDNTESYIEDIQDLEDSLENGLMLGYEIEIGTVYNYGPYEKEPLIFARLRLEDTEKYNLIEMFERLYGNTGQDTEEYAFELVIVIRALFDGEVILNAKKLVIGDCLESIKQLLSPEQWADYYLDYYLLNGGEKRC